MGRKTSTWEDTGRDCPYCGSEILQRIDADEKTGHELALYECENCAAQWDLRWHLQRSGRRLSSERRAKLVENGPPVIQDQMVPRWVWFVLVAVLVLIVARFGLPLLRLLLIPLIFGLVVYLFYQLGRDQMWW